MDGITEAAWQGDLSEVQRLVGQDPGLLNNVMPLIRASWRGRLEIVRWLVDQGVAVNGHYGDARTALYNASSTGQAPVVKLLLERGADPTIITQDGSTP
jgi:ankyrin repeat protein